MSIVPRRGPRVTALAALLCLAAVACTEEPVPPASGDPDGTSLVLAVADEPASLNPLAGYAQHGAAKIFEGLLEHREDGSLAPRLAAEMPTPSLDGRSWTVNLRGGVTFSDGSAFNADDVVATYRAVLDPAFASPLRPRYSVLSGVHQVDRSTVRFDLFRPYAPFLTLLTLGIMPGESLAKPEPVTDKPLRDPVGTGPFRLTDYQPGERMVLSANKRYVSGPPAITKVTIEFIADAQSRADRMRNGKLDGAPLPHVLAAELGDVDGLQVVTHDAAELRAVVLPETGPVTGDPAVRLALNYAVNRPAMVEAVLVGQGSEASTPLPSVLTEFVEPAATYQYDITRALDVLTGEGWEPGSDGIRVKNGTVARFTLRYPEGDRLAERLANAFAADASAVGVRVNLEATDPDQLVEKPTDAALISFGDPFDPDLSLYRLLHSTPGNGDRTANPGGYTNETVDAALEAGRSATDPAQRAAAYRKLQRAYLDQPGMVVLVEPDHSYVLRQSWNGYVPVVDGVSAGMTWGAWWNLADWTPR